MSELSDYCDYHTASAHGSFWRQWNATYPSIVFPFLLSFFVVVVVVVSLIQQSGTRTGLHGVFISPMRECSLRRLVIY